MGDFCSDAGKTQPNYRQIISYMLNLEAYTNTVWPRPQRFGRLVVHTRIASCVNHVILVGFLLDHFLIC